MTSTSGGKLHIFHGGEFQRVPKSIYSECECSDVKVDINLLRVDDIKDVVRNYGIPMIGSRQFIYVGMICHLRIVWWQMRVMKWLGS